MAGEIRSININEIVNYHENPRHAIAMNEKDTLKKLFMAVGNHYMLNLADDIRKNGLLGNQQLVVVYNEAICKYVVYEGNRRLAAIKLLMTPTRFDFLDKTTYKKVLSMSQEVKEPIQDVLCYVTNEEEAFFIMERLHSGEDKGRGVKAWSAREKDVFKMRKNGEKTLSYLIDFYVKKYFDNFDITTLMPFTTIQRIFGNKTIKAEIGLDPNNEKTFTKAKIQLVINVSKNVVENARKDGVSITRLYNHARDIEEKVLPIIKLYNTQESYENLSSSKDEFIEENNLPHTSKETEINDFEKKKEDVVNNILSSSITQEHTRQVCRGDEKNLPYFFMGLDYSHLNPLDVNSHGISAVCNELRYFSEKKLVDKLPVAASFLIRAAVEHSIIYYSKRHNIQGQDKPIWENIQNLSKLSKIIDNYNKNLANYIPDKEIRQYFTALFNDYEHNMNQFNWVVHRTTEYQIDAKTLAEYPKRGLLAVINYLIAD